MGPGGDPQGVLYNNGAGNVWFSKLFTTRILMTEDLGEHTSEGARPALERERRRMDFRLARRIKWHDGEDFTACDLKFTTARRKRHRATIPISPFGRKTHTIQSERVNCWPQPRRTGLT